MFEIHTYRPRSVASVEFYDESALMLSELYESTTFESVHSTLLDILPARGSKVVDVGAGSGRDAAALSRMGYIVTGVEPSAGLRAEAARRHGSQNIEWVDDALPGLTKLAHRGFDFILVSAVWMHLPADERYPAIRRLAELLYEHGLLVVTVRNGPADPRRAISQVDVSDLEADAKRVKLKQIRCVTASDTLGRSEISWTTLVFERPGS